MNAIDAFDRFTPEAAARLIEQLRAWHRTSRVEIVGRDASAIRVRLTLDGEPPAIIVLPVAEDDSASKERTVNEDEVNTTATVGGMRALLRAFIGQEVVITLHERDKDNNEICYEGVLDCMQDDVLQLSWLKMTNVTPADDKRRLFFPDRAVEGDTVSWARAHMIVPLNAITRVIAVAPLDDTVWPEAPTF